MATKDTTNISDSVHLDRKEFEQVRIIVEQIAYHADITSGTLCSGLGLSKEEYEESNLLFSTAMEMMGKIGWLAELAAGKLSGTGRPEYKGGVESWMLPPVYNRLDEEMEVQS